MSYDKIRREYESKELRKKDLVANPFEQFRNWLDDAIAAELSSDPTAMVVATCADNKPTQRVVLLKKLDDEGFVFYTNLHSQKARQLKQNPNCSLHFAWLPMERQVTILGHAQLLTKEENEQYFHSRPRASQLAAWASEQSQTISDREALDTKMVEAEKRFEGQDVPLPHFWGGFRIVPETFEFWQGRRARLHDRFCYSLSGNANWVINRLQP